MSKHLTGVIIAALAAVVLAVPATPTSADHRPGNVVVMGGTFAFTGYLAVRAKRFINTTELYVDELNARGGLLGHRVELKILDDRSDVRTAIELYEKLIAEDKVDLVLGPVSSKLTDPVANVMERYRRPFLAHGSNPVMFQRGRKYIFSYTPIAPNYHKGALHLARQIGVKRIAFLTQASLGSRAQFLGAQKWAKRLGFNVVFSERFRPGQTDFRPHLQRIEASGAEAIVSVGNFPAHVAQVRQLRELDINVKLLSMTIGPAVPGFVEELGGLAEYVLGYSAWEPKPDVLGHPGMEAFIESYEKRYRIKPGYHASAAWAKLQILEAAVKEAGSFDPEMLRDALASITVQTIRGQYKADERGLGVVEGVTFQIQNGERVIVWPAIRANR